jgi:hypothetical protein
MHNYIFTWSRRKPGRAFSHNHFILVPDENGKIYKYSAKATIIGI